MSYKKLPEVTADVISKLTEFIMNSDASFSPDLTKKEVYSFLDSQTDALVMKLDHKTYVIYREGKINFKNINKIFNEHSFSKNSTKALSHAYSRYLSKPTPYRAVNVLRKLATLYCKVITSYSGAIGFTEEVYVSNVVDPNNIPNHKKRSVRDINRQLKSLYADVKRLKEEKYRLINSIKQEGI